MKDHKRHTEFIIILLGTIPSLYLKVTLPLLYRLSSLYRIAFVTSYQNAGVVMEGRG